MLEIQTAKSKAEAVEILHGYDLPEEDFTVDFPHLAKLVRNLPDETSAAA
ncbi:hypothetical protein ACFU51_03125 [Streptomyces sp. NPDC057430]